MGLFVYIYLLARKTNFLEKQKTSKGKAKATFACLIGKQFHNFRFGDRFWYENGGWPSSFTLEQLAEIRRVKLSRVLCDNSDDLETVQVYAMVLPDHEINPRVPCKSGVLPRIDLNKWRDASFHSAPSSTFFSGFGKK